MSRWRGWGDAVSSRHTSSRLRISGSFWGARAPGELAVVDQVREVGLDFVVGDLVWGPAVVLRQARHGGDVRLEGARRESADGHVAQHPGTEFAHGRHLLRVMTARRL